MLRVIDALEEHDDVQNVYANFDIPDDVLQSVYAMKLDDARDFVREQHDAIMLTYRRDGSPQMSPDRVQRRRRRVRSWSARARPR